jgi:hypothetical protein
MYSRLLVALRRRQAAWGPIPKMARPSGVARIIALRWRSQAGFESGKMGRGGRCLGERFYEGGRVFCKGLLGGIGRNGFSKPKPCGAPVCLCSTGACGCKGLVWCWEEVVQDLNRGMNRFFGESPLWGGAAMGSRHLVKCLNLNLRACRRKNSGPLDPPGSANEHKQRPSFLPLAPLHAHCIFRGVRLGVTPWSQANIDSASIRLWDRLDLASLVRSVLQSARFLLVPILSLHPPIPSHYQPPHLAHIHPDRFLFLSDGSSGPCLPTPQDPLTGTSFKSYCYNNPSPPFLSPDIMSKRICACGCERLVSESTERRHQDGQGPRTLTLHVLSANPWVKSLGKKNVTQATVKKTLLGRPGKHPHQLRTYSTPLPDVDIPPFTYDDLDDAELANSGGMVTRTVMCCRQYGAQTVSPPRLPKSARIVGHLGTKSSSKKTIPRTRRIQLANI